jgi:glycosyltransferase involved in cell wall biosynthesis
MVIEMTSVFGFIDSLERGEVRGWAVNRQSLRHPVELALLINGEELARTLTCVERLDVAWKYDCHPTPGFVFSIPFERLRQQRFTVEVRETSTGKSLPMSALAQPGHAHEVVVSPGSLELLQMRGALHDQFRGQPEVLLKLNNHPGIRLNGLDPALAAVWIINGAKGMHAELFRTYGLASALRELGISTLIFDVEDVPYLRHITASACFFVRVACDAAVESLVGRLRDKKVPVICDFDDLVFRPSLISKIDGVRFLPREQQEAYARGMTSYRKMLEFADLVSVTTPWLEQEATRFNRQVARLSNFPLEDARRAASQAAKRAPDSHFVVGYYSGTLTHQADLKTASKGIARFLQKHPEAIFRIVGMVDLSEFPEFERLPNVLKVGLMPYADMIRDMAGCDVVIAPLQVGDAFCESKSELKFFDAALVGVPVIASPTTAFKGTVESEVNGVLAQDHDEWCNALERLRASATYRSELARKAMDTVTRRYSFRAQADAVRAILDRCGVVPESAARIERSPCLPQRPPGARPVKSQRLVVLLPDIGPGSGGHRKVLTWCHMHARAGGTVTVYFMSDRSDSDLRNIVHQYYFSDCGRIHAYDGRDPEGDVAVATSWPTAYLVDKWSAFDRKYYFIQDFEPLFSPMSSDYALAYHSYQLGLKHVVFGDWNSRMLAKEFGKRSEPIRFPVDREIYSPAMGVKREPLIVFYARPSQPRRLYELGLHALRQVRPLLPNVRFLLFGEEQDATSIDGFDFAGRQTDLHELAKLYSRGMLGISFSTTNPTLVTFEMLACGLPVIDVAVGLESDDFVGCEAVIRVEPTVDALARAIYRLASDPVRCDALSKDALRWAENLPSELDFGEQVLGQLGLVG